MADTVSSRIYYSNQIPVSTRRIFIIREEFNSLGLNIKGAAVFKSRVELLM